MGPRFLVSFALAALCVVGAATASAQGPDKEKRTRAASEYDAGSAAFKKKDFEGAAAHFESADEAVPSHTALRQAIRARSEAGQGARAATLALLALERYPNVGPLAKLSRDTVEKYEIVVHKVHVACASPCTVSVGKQAVPGQARAKWDVYLDPGKATVTAALDDDTVTKSVEAKPGGESDLRFEAKAAPPPPPVVPEVPVETPPKSDVPPDDKPKDDTANDKPEDNEPRKGISPVFFGISAAAFVGLGAATIWSGVDTINNPGQATVRAQCQGLGTACPAYQTGLAHQTRTNVLGGVTGGFAATTIVLGIFTNWHGAKKAPEDKPATEPTAIFLDRGAVLGARGSF